jgi:hypothetical protein
VRCSSRSSSWCAAFEQGSGQLDIARAIRQPVIASPSSLSLGLARWPHDDDPLLERTVTVRNTGAVPVRFALSAALRGPDRQAAPEHMARVTPSAIDVPAGGSIDVVVTIDTNGDALDGRYEGALVATGDDFRTITPIAVEREVESYDLTIRTRGPDGTPELSFTAVIGLEALTLEFVEIPGEISLRRPRGHYTLLSQFSFPLFMAYPRLTLDRDVVADLDGRLARPILPSVPGVDPPLQSAELWYLDVEHLFGFGFRGVDRLFSASFGPESSAVESGAVVSSLLPFDQSEPDTVYMLAHRERGHFLTGWTEVIDARRLARVDAHHVGNGISCWRKWATVILDDAPQLGVLGGALGFADYPGTFDRTEYYYGPGLRFVPLVFESAATFIDIPLTVTLQNRAKLYAPGSRSTETWNRAPFGPAFAELEGTPAAQRTGDVLTVSPSMTSDQASPPRLSITLLHNDRTALYRDGVLLVEHVDVSENFFPPVAVAPDPATYRLERSISRGDVTRFNGEPLFELSTEVSAAWTFRSAHVDGTALLALPTLRFTPFLDDQNRTAARSFLLPFKVERPVGAPTPAITDIRLEVSFDDGERWTEVPVLRLGDQAMAFLRHPPKALFVSLRGSASDVAGNRVEQTIIHAYGLGRTEN